MTRPRTLYAWLVGLAFTFVMPTAAHAQLLSPGPLAKPHAALEGLRNCTSCHQLGQRGVSAERCLNCHEALATRIRAREGYHATVSTTTCADCHKDHLGVAFDVRRLDQTSFDHAATGYELLLSHDSVACADCHTPANIHEPTITRLMTESGGLARTFLGLGTECAGCHRDESPHGDQFGSQGCAECHDEGEWERPPNFDHAATSFPLEGLHTTVACSECHGTGAEAIYRPLAFGACNDCHADPHGGRMQGACSSCHGVQGWTTISGNMERSFNHASTGFPLTGAHASAQCVTCHRAGSPPRTALLRMTYVAGTQRSTYPRPLYQTCRSCHVDRHTQASGEARWTDCLACHSDSRWTPSPYSVARHAASVFPLTGAHAVTSCLACHQNAERGHTQFILSLPGQACVDCHRADDPHKGLYEGKACSDCHVTDAWEEATFDHAVVLERAAPVACTTCHATDDPHAGQFEGRDCAACHATEAFAIEFFDHSKTTFPLDGAHDDAPCASCHATESGPPAFVRYRPLGTECADCHRSI